MKNKVNSRLDDLLSVFNDGSMLVPRVVHMATHENMRGVANPTVLRCGQWRMSDFSESFSHNESALSQYLAERRSIVYTLAIVRGNYEN